MRPQWAAEARAGIRWAHLFKRQCGIILRTEVSGRQPLSWAPWFLPPSDQGLCDPAPLRDVPVTNSYLDIERRALWHERTGECNFHLARGALPGSFDGASSYVRGLTWQGSKGDPQPAAR